MITLILCAILGLLMGSYLWFLQTQQKSVARSQQWHKAMVMAEAGVDEAMALLNSGIILTSFATDARWIVNSTTITGRALAPAAKQQFDGSYYTVVINKPISPSTNPVITATGFVPVPLSSQVVSRTVQVVTKPKPAFPIKAPMIVVSGFTANGYNIGTDSFDSSLTNLFPGGIYNSANAMDDGDIISLSTNNGAVKIGNAKVKGQVRTPPGGVQGVTATVGSQGSVGDSAYVNNGNNGFQSGHFHDDVNFTFDPVVLPNVTWYAPQQNITVGTNTYKYVTGSSLNYTLSSLGSGQTIYVNYPNTVLYISGNVTINADQVVMAPGASLSMYVGGTSTDIGGQGIVNGSGVAKNFIYYGLPTNTDIKFSGNANYVGSVYAPNADFKLGGGGNDTYDFAGACITKTTTMNGHFKFHYDEALQWLTRPNGFSAISWTEP